MCQTTVFTTVQYTDKAVKYTATNGIYKRCDGSVYAMSVNITLYEPKIP